MAKKQQETTTPREPLTKGLVTGQGKVPQTPPPPKNPPKDESKK
jgi:hypothetical protein